MTGDCMSCIFGITQKYFKWWLASNNAKGDNLLSVLLLPSIHLLSCQVTLMSLILLNNCLSSVTLLPDSVFCLPNWTASQHPHLWATIPRHAYPGWVGPVPGPHPFQDTLCLQCSGSAWLGWPPSPMTNQALAILTHGNSLKHLCLLQGHIPGEK